MRFLILGLVVLFSACGSQKQPNTCKNNVPPFPPPSKRYLGNI